MPARSRSRSDPAVTPSVRPTEGVGGAFDLHLHLSRFWPDLASHSYGSGIDYTLPGLLREMDRSGVSSGLLIPPVETPGIREGHAELEELRVRSHGRLRIASTIDPTRGSPRVAEDLAALSDMGSISAIKLYPGYLPFYPHDPRLDPLYEYASNRGLPVLLHQGDTLHATARLRFARPLEVDEVAVRFPELRLVLCHFGNPWIEEAAELVYKNSNVYADTSGLLSHPGRPYFPEMVRRVQRQLENAIAAIGAVDRVLFGSDWPLISISTSVDLVRGLPLHGGDADLVLGGNARRLLGAPSPAPLDS